MKSLDAILARQEGYLAIEHRFSPGVPDEVMVACGLPHNAGRKDTVFEAAMATCSHCEAQVFLNPDRTRPRYVCKRCTHYLCDHCSALMQSGGECFPLKARVLEAIEAADRGLPTPLILL